MLDSESETIIGNVMFHVGDVHNNDKPLQSTTAISLSVNSLKNSELSVVEKMHFTCGNSFILKNACETS